MEAEILCPICGSHIQGVLREEHICDRVEMEDLTIGSTPEFPVDGPWRKVYFQCSGCKKKWSGKALIKCLKGE